MNKEEEISLDEFIASLIIGVIVILIVLAIIFWYISIPIIVAGLILYFWLKPESEQKIYRKQAIQFKKDLAKLKKLPKLPKVPKLKLCDYCGSEMKSNEKYCILCGRYWDKKQLKKEYL